MYSWRKIIYGEQPEQENAAPAESALLQQVFHIDAFNFGRSLVPLLKTDFDKSSKSVILSVKPIIEIRMPKSKSIEHILVKFLISYESYRSKPNRVMTPLYTNQYKYVESLVARHALRLQIFRDAGEVLSMVKKQMDAHLQAIRGEPGWQAAMRDAGI